MEHVNYFMALRAHLVSGNRMKISVIMVEKSLGYLDGYTCPTSIISFSS